MKRNDVIKINGRRYNVVTGARVDEPAKIVTKEQHAPAKKRITRSEKQAQLAHEIAHEIAEYDSKAPMRRTRKPAVKKTTQKAPGWVNNFVDGKAPTEITADQGFISRKARAAYSHSRAASKALTTRHRTQISTTLNRHFVHAPKAKVVASTERRATKPSVTTSPLIQHFARTAAKNTLKTTGASTRNALKPEKTTVKKTFTNSSARLRVHEREKPYIEHPTEIVANHQLSSVVRKPQKPTVASHALRRPTNNSRTSYGTKFLRDIQLEAHETAHHSDSKMLKEALIREQLNSPIAKLSPRERRQAERLQRRLIRREESSHRRMHAGVLVIIGVAMLLSGGYLAYVNMPSIALHAAASEAGVNVKTPATISGYAATGNVIYESGQVTVKYRNNGGGSGYSLTQSNTNLNTASLRETIASNNGKPIGDGVYRYGNTAVWMSGGTLFTLNGNSYITNDQVRQIATSVKQ